MVNTKTSVKKKTNQKKEKIVNEAKIEKNPFNFGFSVRLFVNVLIIIGSFIGLLYCTKMTFKNAGGRIVTYTEKSNVDYKVYLKKNNFYDKPFLDKDMVYVASLIDKIVIDYDYNFKVNEASDINFIYNIVAKLVITSQNNSKVFFEKNYVLLDAVTEEITDSKKHNINKEVTINYADYNNLANQFKSNYAVNTISYLDVYLQVQEHNKDSNSYTLNRENKTLLRIPISEQEVNINLDNERVNEEHQVVSDNDFLVRNKRYLYIAGSLLVILNVFLIRLIRKIRAIISRISFYDRYIKRILRAYDRIIVNVTTEPNLKDYNVIKVETFNELIDVRDNTKEPIKYYVVDEHHKCEFFVTNDRDLYLFVIEEVYIMDKKKKKS